MFTFLLKIKRRIKKLLKVQSDTRQRPPSSFHSRTFKFLLLVLISLLVGIIYPGTSLYDPLDMPREGEIALEDVIAPFKITVLKTEREVRDEMEVKKLAEPHVIDYDTVIANHAYGGLDGFFALVDSLRKKFPSADTTARKEQISRVSMRFPLLYESAIVESLECDDLDLAHRRLREIYENEIYKIGVLPDRYSLPESRNRNVLIRRGDQHTIYSRDGLYPMATANSRLLTALNRLSASDSIDVEYYYQVGRTFIQPNLRINMAEYDRRVEEALASVSKVKEIVARPVSMPARTPGASGIVI